MKYTITGDNLQFVNIELGPNEAFLSSNNAMRYMTGNMRMEAVATGGAWHSLKRMVAGESLFQLRYRSEGGSGVIGLGGNCPGKIADLDIGQGSWIVQRTGYLGAEPGVNLELAFQKRLGSIFFGGEGLILQKLTGSGRAFIAACGDFNIVDLKPGETYKIATGNAVAWEESVKYDITATGGFKTALFGGNGLFLTTLTGPGKIIIQSMTLSDLAMALVPFLPSQTRS